MSLRHSNCFFSNKGPMLHVHHLPNQAPDEQVIFLLRRHKIVLLGEVVRYILLGSLPFLVRFVLERKASEFFDRPEYIVVVMFLFFAFELFMWLLLYRAFIDYYLDVWIVTNKRIINIEQMDLFHRRLSEQKLFRVQDVSSLQKGMLATLFDYGNVSVQTAAEQARFEFEQIPRPNEIARRINELVENEKHQHQQVTI